MAQNETVMLVGVRITKLYKEILSRLALNRSAELGRRVCTGFVIQELIEQHLQTTGDQPRSPTLFGAYE